MLWVYPIVQEHGQDIKERNRRKNSVVSMATILYKLLIPEKISQEIKADKYTARENSLGHRN